jgi:hypothetical protein
MLKRCGRIKKMKKWILKAFMLFFVPLACAVTELDDPRKGRSAIQQQQGKKSTHPDEQKRAAEDKRSKAQRALDFYQKKYYPNVDQNPHAQRLY